jgi:two-component system response regulator PilR (NtrC family)
LENILERALALSSGETITADDLHFSKMAPRSPATRSRRTDEPGAQPWAAPEAYGDLEGYLDDIERQIISTALEESRWNKTATAKLLGISFRSLRYRLKKLNLEE